MNLRDSFARIDKGDVSLMHVPISSCGPTRHAHHYELRQRTLLLHQHEIEKLAGQVNQKGLTLVPLHLYVNGGRTGRGR